MKPPQQLYEGTSPCGRPRCKSCMHIRTGNTFESATTGEKFQAHVRPFQFEQLLQGNPQARLRVGRSD